MGGSVLLTGLGHLGGPLLDRLATSVAVERVVAVSRDAERGEARCNLARLSAAAVGASARIEHRAVDVDEPDRFAELVAACAPDLVVHTASLQTWWLIDALPADAQALRAAGFGAWLPLHLALAMRVMEGLGAAGYRGPVVNACYPDVVNVVLARHGVAPTAGIGNVDELVAKVRMIVGTDLSLAPHDLDVLLVAHHALQRAAFSVAPPRRGNAEELPPFFLRVAQKGRDLTEQVDARGALLAPCPLPEGPAWGAFTAASAAGLIGALLSDGKWRMHAPGPLGLPGGYPVDLGGGVLEIAEIPELPTEEAVAINERSHRFDGIERIEDDGRVVFTEQTAAVMRDTLGFDHGALAAADAAPAAAELSDRFERFASSHGVDLGQITG